jgi:hypothetical protein
MEAVLVKDAYTALKDLIKNRYQKVSIEQLEQAPESKRRRAVVPDRFPPDRTRSWRRGRTT